MLQSLSQLGLPLLAAEASPRRSTTPPQRKEIFFKSLNYLQHNTKKKFTKFSTQFNFMNFKVFF